MLSQNFISSLKEKCNNLQCPDCGKHHQVTLSFDRGVLFKRYAPDSCVGFKDAVDALIKTEISRFMNDPSPFLK